MNPLGQADGGARYVVESGRDGSWLVVDRGDEREQRVAIAREDIEQVARWEADNLAWLDGITSNFETATSPEWAELGALACDLTAQIDAEYNYNHLLVVDTD